MAGVDLTSADVHQGLFVEASAPKAIFAHCNLEQSIWHRAACPGANFQSSNLTYAEFYGADVTGADFNGATMFRARLHGIKDGGARFPLARGGALGTEEDLATAEAWWLEHQRAWKGDGDA
jgi:uncharacterized protein YjbI with pentapeptide repeats